MHNSVPVSLAIALASIMICDEIADKKNRFIYYGKRVRLSCLLFLALSSDFYKHTFKNHSQVVSSKPPLNIIQKSPKTGSRPNGEVKTSLFFPLSIFQTVPEP